MYLALTKFFWLLAPLWLWMVILLGVDHLKYGATGHLTYNANGHLVYDCPPCPCDCTFSQCCFSTGQTITVSISITPQGDCTGSCVDSVTFDACDGGGTSANGMGVSLFESGGVLWISVGTPSTCWTGVGDSFPINCTGTTIHSSTRFSACTVLGVGGDQTMDTTVVIGAC